MAHPLRYPQSRIPDARWVRDLSYPGIWLLVREPSGVAVGRVCALLQLRRTGDRRRHWRRLWWGKGKPGSGDVHGLLRYFPSRERAMRVVEATWSEGTHP